MKIDLHTHTYFQDFADYLATRNELPYAVIRDGRLVTACSPAYSSSSPPGHREIEAKLTAMDAMGVDFSVLTHGIPGPELLGGAEADEWASRINDFLARVVEQYPGRFVAMGSLGFGDPDRTIAEAERCVKDLGFRGFQLFSNTHGKPLDSPEFMPVYRRIAALGVPLNLHPTAPLNTAAIEGTLMPGIGFIYDTSLATVRLIQSGIFDEEPGFELIVPNIGGVLPYLGGRIRANVKGALRPVSDYFTRIYVDTVAHSDDALAYCYRMVGADRLLLGTDHPFVDGHHIGMVDRLDCTEDEREAIYHGNAERLLRL